MAEDYSKRLPYVMRRVSQALSGRLERTLHPFGLTHAQLSALAQLGLEPGRGASGAVLARGAGLTAQSMSEAVAALLERELVTRTPHPTHGRVLEVRITGSGLDLLTQAQQASAAVEDHALAALSEGDREQLKALLEEVAMTLQIDPGPHRACS